MPKTKLDAKEVVERGRALYEERIRDKVEPALNGKVIALDIETGEYEVDDDVVPAAHRILDTRPEATLYLGRIGHPALDRMGTRFKPVAGS